MSFTSHNNLNEIVTKTDGPLCILFLDPDLDECKFVQNAILKIKEDCLFASIDFRFVPVNGASELLKQYKIDQIPTVLLFLRSKPFDRVVGTDIRLIRSKLTDVIAQAPLHKNMATDDDLRKLTTKEKVMIFIKGTPTEPKCGFTRSAIEILNRLNIKFGYFDILEDGSVRQGLKKLYDWPTYPQLYKDGKLIGGLDTMKRLSAEGILVSILQ
ncbi:hypothetical protein GJ496_001418 [Pomphorhynchus laevis]|nr:hypothetical protein GJ496_001418 [Pomphorhynchus laevis]